MNFIVSLLPGIITSLIASLVIFLVRPMWKRLKERAPAPLTLQAKVTLADQLEQNRRQLERVEHFAAHPNDLFLELFRFALAIFALAVTALACLTYAVAHESEWARDTLSPAGCISTLCFVTAFILMIFAFILSWELSAKRINLTKTKLLKAISDAELTLGPVASAGTEGATSGITSAEIVVAKKD